MDGARELVSAGVRAALLTTHLRLVETLRSAWSIILFYFIPTSTLSSPLCLSRLRFVLSMYRVSYSRSLKILRFFI